MTELKIQTKIGEMTVIFESIPINCYENIYTAWLKEKPSVIVESNSIENAINEIYISLDLIIDYKNNNIYQYIDNNKILKKIKYDLARNQMYEEASTMRDLVLKICLN